MNNFFLRPWATGPVFGADEEGGGGGGDEETAVDPFARSARTQARIETGRAARTGSTPPGEAGRDYTGSIPRQTPTNINADTTAGESGPLQSSGVAFDGVISGNDDPDNVFAQSFVPPSDILSSLSDEFQGGTDTSGMPGILTSMGNMIVSPAGGATPSRPNLDGINPQGPTYTPPPVSTDRSFLENVGDAFSGVGNTVYNFINPDPRSRSFREDLGTVVSTADDTARKGISAGYQLSDEFDDLIGREDTEPLGSMQGQYFDAFGTPVGSAEGIRRADKLREGAAQRVTDMTPGSDYLNSLQDQARRRAAADKQSMDLFGYDTSPGLVEKGVTDLAGTATNFYGGLRDYFTRPTDQGGSSLPSVATQDAARTSQRLGDQSTMTLAMMNEADRDAYLRPVYTEDGGLDFGSIMAKTKAASPSAVLGVGSAIVNPYLAMGVSAPLYAGEADGDRRSQVKDLYDKGILQESDAFKKEAAKFDGSGDLALASVISNISNDNFATDAALGATLGLAESKILGARNINKALRPAYTGVLEGFEEGGVEKDKTRFGLTEALDIVDGAKAPIVPEVTMQQRLDEGLPAAALGLLTSGFAGGTNVGAPNSGLDINQAMDLTAQSNMLGNQQRALTTPINTGIAGLQPESNINLIEDAEVIRQIAPPKTLTLKSGETVPLDGRNYVLSDGTIFMGENAGVNPQGSNFNPRGGRTPANEFAGTETLANQAIANDLANRTSPNPNDLAGTNVQQEFNFQRPPDMDAVFDPAAGLGPAFTDPAVAAQRDQQARLNALSPSGETNPLVNEIIQGRNQPVAPDMNTRNAFDPVGGQGPAAFGRSSFADIGPSGTSNPLVSEILAARNIPTAPGPEVTFDPASGLGPAFTDPAVTIARQAQAARDAAARDASTGGAQQRAAFPDLAPSGETNPLVNEIIAARSAGLAPGPDASFTARDTPITPEQTFENQLKGVRTARAFTPPASMETNQNLFPVSNVLPSNEQGPNYTPPARRQRGPDQTPERMLAKNQVPTTLENVMQDLVLEQNVNPLTGEILNPAPAAFVAPAVKTGTTIEGTVNPPTTTVLETNQNLFPVSPVVPETPEDDGPVIDIPTFPETTGGDDDNIPPDDGGNCPPGYELKLINGMYVCVPIDQVEDEVEEEEETPAVTYGRPGIGVYYQPRTVAPITPYVLNPNEVV